LCHICDGRHHNDRYNRLDRLFRSGKMAPFEIMAAAAIEDAWMTGRTEMTQDGTILIPEAPERWEIALAWVRCTGGQIPVADYAQMAMVPWIGRRNTHAVREEIRHAINRAMCALVPSYRGCTIEAKGHDVTSGEVEINLQMDDDEIPAAVTLTEGVDVPDDIFLRKHAEA
jgi:hypothetical protein